MLPAFKKIKGIHPGALLRWELDHIKMKGVELAKAIGEHKQTISAVLNQRRDMNPTLSIKLSEILKVDPDYFMMLQASYDVKQTALENSEHRPDLSKFRKALFWETSYDLIDWKENITAIIKRVLERGNEDEINELLRFYGRSSVIAEVKQIKKSHLPSFEKNITKYKLQ